MAQEQALSKTSTGKNAQTLVMGGILGALTGVGVAYLLVKRSEQQGGDMSLTTGEGLRLGLLVLGLLRQVSDLAVPDEE
ncbi:MAG: hypothetical protein ACLFWD_04565 [Anaerolineales bacterium]